MKKLPVNSLLQLRLTGIRHDTVLSGPEFIHLDITNACNLRCAFCWVHSPLVKKRQPREHLSFKAIKRIIDAGVKWNTATFGISGDGEPTLHPDIASIIDYATKNGQSLLLWTNLYTPSRALLAKLCKASYLCVTLCATNAQEYRQLHGGSFSRIERNLEILAQVRKKFNKPTIILSYILCKPTYTRIQKIISFCEHYGISSIEFKLADCSAATKQLALNEAEQSALIAEIQKALRRPTPVSTNLASLRQRLMHYDQSPSDFKHCWVGWFSLFFNYTGQARLCCFYDRLSAGTIHTASAESIWHSKKMHRLRLKAKYSFDLNKRPWKYECRWCPFIEQNRMVEKRLKELTKQ